ncbi:MAG: hypothetical protein KGL12_13885 [Rhodospirillales bacterium]|nr:hypothetical protein [Rhodospirillales bacterium]
MSSEQADDLRLPLPTTAALPTILREAATRLPFAAVSPAPRSGDTVDLVALLAAGRDAPDLARLGPALAAALVPLRGAGGNAADQAAAGAALAEARLGPPDLVRPDPARSQTIAEACSRRPSGS